MARSQAKAGMSSDLAKGGRSLLHHSLTFGGFEGRDRKPILRDITKRQFRIVTVVCAFGFAIAQVNAEDQFLVDAGKANAEIIISESPSRSTRLASVELQTYVAKISGTRLSIRAEPSADVPVQIYVGESPYAAKFGVTADRLEHGVYRITSGKDWLALIGDDTDFQPHVLHAIDVSDRARIRREFDRLTGGRWAMPIDKTDRRRHVETGWWQDDRRGSLNAVHDFLRSPGVRWFMPGELGEVVPERDSIPLLRVDKIVRPDFAMRHHDCNRWDLISRDEILWHFGLGLNWGGEYLGLGRRHAMQAVLAREEMKLEHPDYYAIWGGKRQTDYLGEGTPCLSSETFFAEHVRYVRAVLDLFDEPVVDIGFPDNMGKTGKFCECEYCMAKYNLDRPFGRLSDYVWGYMNRVSAEVAKTHPDKLVLGYAYQNTFLPPENIERLHPNLAVVLASVWRHKRLHPELRNPAKRDVDAIRRAWAKKVSSGVIYNWEYYLYPRLKQDGWHGTPVYFAHGIAWDLRTLNSIPGMRGEFIEVTRSDPKAPVLKISTARGNRGELYAPGFSHFNVYITSRLYWDTEQAVDELLADYCEKFYGPAEQEMLVFIGFCEQNWPRLSPANPDSDTLCQMQRLLDAAHTAAGDSVYTRRIELVAEYVRPLLP